MILKNSNNLNRGLEKQAKIFAVNNLVQPDIQLLYIIMFFSIFKIIRISKIYFINLLFQVFAENTLNLQHFLPHVKKARFRHRYPFLKMT